MVDNSDYIPANAIRFDEAFERLFDADPRASEIRAELDRLIEAELSGPEYDEAWDRVEVVQKEVGEFFRNELKNGALDAYRRDPYTGQELKIPPNEWEDALILAGTDLEFPPSYFLETEFDSWLKKTKGDIRKHGRRPSAVETAKRVINALYPNGVPNDKATSTVWNEVGEYCRDPEHREWPPSYSSVQRALGRRN
jgi:hypothetical protein